MMVWLMGCPAGTGSTALAARERVAGSVGVVERQAHHRDTRVLQVRLDLVLGVERAGHPWQGERQRRWRGLPPGILLVARPVLAVRTRGLEVLGVRSDLDMEVEIPRVAVSEPISQQCDGSARLGLPGSGIGI